MIRGVMEMLPLMSDSERGSAQEGSEAAVFRLPDAESVTLDGSMGDSMGENIMEGVGARSEQEAPSEETREDVAVGDDTATETDSEGTSVEAKDDGEVRAADSRGGEKRQSAEESSGHKDDTVEAQQAARMGLVDQMASQSERLASAGKKGRISASDLLAAGRKKVLDLDGLAARRLQGRKGGGINLGDAMKKGDGALQRGIDLAGTQNLSEDLDAAKLLRDGARTAISDAARQQDGDLADELNALREARKGAVDKSRLVGGRGQDGDSMAMRSGDMAARARRAARAQARHMRQEISSTGALRATSATAEPKAVQEMEAPQASRTDLANHVAREVKKAVQEMDKGKSKVSGDEAKLTSLQSTQLTDGGSSNAQLRTPTVQLGPAQPVETFNLDPKVSEALRSLHQTEETQTVLKLNNGNAGKIEVRLRMDGRDLTVQMKADDVEGRQKMLEALPELRRELAKAQLVAGRVDITEFGHAEFDLNGEGQSFDQEDAEDTGAEMSGDQKGSSPGRSGGSVDTTVTSGTQSRDDGRLHVVV